MMQIERANPFSPTRRTILDRLPLIGSRRERKRVDQGEDPLTLFVARKLMRDLTTKGFTVTYIMEREVLAGNSVNKMRHITDTRSTTQEQKVILRGREGKLYSVSLESSQAKEEDNVTDNSLSLTMQDHIEEGPQRFAALYKTQDFPGFFNSKRKVYSGKYFYGVNVKNWEFDSWFNLKDNDYPVFLSEVLESEVDTELTQLAFERLDREQRSQNTPRSTVMVSIVWNKKPEKSLS